MSNYTTHVRFGPELTPLIKWIIILNSGIFVVRWLLASFGFSYLVDWLALSPTKVNHFHVYQLLTYAFLHIHFLHLLFNMLVLWMFGSELEDLWGKKNFLYFYLFGAVSGGLMTWLIDFWFPQGTIVGASGAIFSVIIAYAMIWPNREVLVMLIFPIKIKYLVFLIMIPMTIFAGEGIAQMAHLGGALFGLTYWYANRKFRFSFENFFDLDDYIRRKKFKIYQEKLESRTRDLEKVDQLLDKISKYGYNSLTNKEKKFLNEASHKYYQDSSEK